MTHALKTLNALIAAVALMGATTSWAEQPLAGPASGEAARSVAPGEAVALPEIQTSGNVSYVTGGIPHEQIPAFTRARGSFPLHIEVYEKNGAKNAFTADANVKLIDRHGAVVLETKTEGPFLWVKAPPGAYRLQTTLNGMTKEQRVTVGTGRTSAVVVFPLKAR